MTGTDVLAEHCGHTCPDCATGCTRPRYVIHTEHRCALGHIHDPHAAAPGDTPCQVVLVHPDLLARLDAWLAEQGLTRARMPSRPDDLPTYTITFLEETRRG